MGLFSSIGGALGTFFGPVGTAVGAIGGGLIDNNISNKSVSSAQSYNSAEAWADRDLQYNFGKHAIEWRANDARRAGIHPLAAMGANTISPSPSAIGAVNPQLTSDGQDISRAMASAMGAKGRQLQLSLAESQVENQKIQNELLKTELASAQARMKGGQVPPPVPDVQPQPLTPIKGDGGTKNKTAEVGSITQVGFIRTPTGVRPTHSADVKQRIEDDLIQQTAQNIDLYTRPLFSNTSKPGNKLLNKLYPGATGWKWSVKRLEWQPVYKNKMPNGMKHYSESDYEKFKKKNYRSGASGSWSGPSGSW